MFYLQCINKTTQIKVNIPWTSRFISLYLAHKYVLLLVCGAVDEKALPDLARASSALFFPTI